MFELIFTNYAEANLEDAAYAEFSSLYEAVEAAYEIEDCDQDLFELYNADTLMIRYGDEMHLVDWWVPML